MLCYFRPTVTSIGVDKATADPAAQGGPPTYRILKFVDLLTL